MINIQRMSQLYNTLIHSHEAVNYAENEMALFTTICQDVLTITDIKMAWIGLIDETIQQLNPLVHCGEGTEYLQDIHIDVSADNPSGNGPSGIACREDQPYWCQDFLHDENTTLWHAQAKKFGWQSSAALPFHKNGMVIGTLNLYSNELNAFDEQTRSLLQKITSNMDYTLAEFENEKSRKKIEEDLIDSHKLLMTIINTVPVRIFWKDKNLNYLGCNVAFAKDAGKSSPDEIVGKNDYQMSWKEQAALYNADDRYVIDSKTSKLSFEEPQTIADGNTVWVRTSKVPLYNSKNESVGILGVYDDITEQKLSENALIESRQHLQAIIENEPECVKLVNPRGQLVEMNSAGLAMLEADTLEEAQNQNLISYLLPEWRTPFLDLHKQVMAGHSGVLEFEIKGLKGTHRWLETHAVPMHDSSSKATMLLGITRDVTEYKETQQKIEFMANYDALTGLPNRLKLEEHLEYLLTLSKRSECSFALMFLDIDHFKDINDTLGHSIGDELLMKFGQRIKGILREEDTLARFGGDEFIILFPDTNAMQAQQIAQKLLSTVYHPFLCEHHELTVTTSIGIAMYPLDGLDKDTLYKNADTAMYRAKNDGRNAYSFFTKEMQTSGKRNLELGNALYYALLQNELHLVYQPQISMTTGKVIGVEALLRWTHPKFGNVSPVEFIPIAENNGLILPIGEWVLKSAIKQMKEWIDKGMSPMIMAVNLSAVQFRNANLPELIEQILHSAGLPPEYLEIELTEGVTMNNPQMAINIMNNLHKIGIKMSIDDFGTGYSSLSYLKKFKVYKLKIDQSFVRDITTDSEDRAIVAAIINMAHSLGLQTIAEGVETIEQLDYLREQGCDEMQGYYYSKPLLAGEFEEKYR
jgi:diguanylate cyclase (GGDEF)-like protein/PAS domain S-box-containing protein